jgi:glycosyltransferase involved in cell wall biosynthesis
MGSSGSTSTILPAAPLDRRALELPGREPSGGADVELSIVMPCLNEARTLGTCVGKAMTFLRDYGIEGEVIVADNGSTDGSQALAEGLGARVAPVADRGYGAALAGGFAAARGRYIIMGDSDDSYDFSEMMPIVEKLREGFDLVMGNRFRGGIEPGAMPPLHRYFGNPGLTAIGRVFFKSGCRDFYCGQRGFRKSAVEAMDLRATGMEFALEMIVKATMMGMRVTEVPVRLARDGRDRPPHLRSWRDGWRSLRFFLLYSPRWLFLYPGVLLMLIGAAAGAWLLPGPRHIGGVTLDVHTLLYCAGAIIVGFQLVVFSVLAKTIAVATGLHPRSAKLDSLLARAPLEGGLAAGFALALAGLAASIYATFQWADEGFGNLDPFRVMRIGIPAVLLLVLGFQIIFSSFILSLLQIPRRPGSAGAL